VGAEVESGPEANRREHAKALNMAMEQAPRWRSPGVGAYGKPEAILFDRLPLR
jgi:hypothetical protein